VDAILNVVFGFFQFIGCAFLVVFVMALLGTFLSSYFSYRKYVRDEPPLIRNLKSALKGPHTHQKDAFSYKIAQLTSEYLHEQEV
jgi:hypothetical protein